MPGNRLTLTEAKKQIEDRELWFLRQEHWGGNVVSDRDEDYVLDALFDIPNV